MQTMTKTDIASPDPEALGPLAGTEKKTGRNLQKGKPGRKPPDSKK
jgi:hypothetical protein